MGVVYTLGEWIDDQDWYVMVNGLMMKVNEWWWLVTEYFDLKTPA